MDDELNRCDACGRSEPHDGIRCSLDMPQVRTQGPYGRGARYGYVITEADGNSWVSHYRWSSAEAAQRAGEVDADACRAGL